MDVDRLIQELIDSLGKRQKEVLIKRFGLKGQRLTLAAIGDKFGITRERVRQIEAAALKNLKPRARAVVQDLADKIKVYLRDAGGVKSDEDLIADLFKKESAPKIHFLLSIHGEPYFYDEDENYKDFWYLDETAKKRCFEYVNELEEKLSRGRGSADAKATAAAHFKNPVSVNLAGVSEKFGVNIFGDFGLSAWPEIKPRVISDKAYLVLKKKNTPLHFRQMADEINALKFDHKKANAQTVHNELIKDSRFVLVGRGMYGLREQGFEPGTAREVIARLLKSNGPAHSHKVVELVKKERFLKENTILLNLQDRRYFKRLDDGRYTVFRQA